MALIPAQANAVAVLITDKRKGEAVKIGDYRFFVAARRFGDDMVFVEQQVAVGIRLGDHSKFN